MGGWGATRWTDWEWPCHGNSDRFAQVVASGRGAPGRPHCAKLLNWTVGAIAVWPSTAPRANSAHTHKRPAYETLPTQPRKLTPAHPPVREPRRPGCTANTVDATPGMRPTDRLVDSKVVRSSTRWMQKCEQICDVDSRDHTPNRKLILFRQEKEREKKTLFCSYLGKYLLTYPGPRLLAPTACC